MWYKLYKFNLKLECKIREYNSLKSPYTTCATSNSRFGLFTKKFQKIIFYHNQNFFRKYFRRPISKFGILESNWIKPHSSRKCQLRHLRNFQYFCPVFPILGFFEKTSQYGQIINICCPGFDTRLI